MILLLLQLIRVTELSEILLPQFLVFKYKKMFEYLRLQRLWILADKEANEKTVWGLETERMKQSLIIRLQLNRHVEDESLFVLRTLGQR